MTTQPAGWSKAQFAEIADLQLGKMLDQRKNRGESTPYLRNVNVRWGAFDLTDVATMPLTAEDRAALDIRDGDLLVCEGGEPARAAVWTLGDKGISFQKALIRVRACAGINSVMLALFLRYAQSERLLDQFFSGTTIRHLPLVALSRVPLPLPPSREQGRIVSKLDGLLGRTARARKELDRVPTLIAHYKQVILAAATSGALTRHWRQTVEGLPAWRELTLADIADVQGGVTKDSKKQSLSDEEVPYLRVANVQRGYLDLREMKTIRVPEGRLKGLLLEPGDILFNEGGDIDKLGRGWVWEGQISRCSFQNHVFRARLFDRANEPKYVSWWGNHRGLDYFLRAGKQTTNLASINKTLLSRLPISMPPPEEQTEIVRRIDFAFTWLDKLTAEHARAAALLPKLEQALLAKAFRGELVPQDPDDEPASVLLERIRSERAAAPDRKRKPRPSKLPSAPRQKATMTKSRLDPEILHQPYLAQRLRDAGGSAKVEDLFRSADLPVTDFYKQLAWEVDAGHVKDQGALLEAA
jgi:type I restriction enzyme S subunit